MQMICKGINKKFPPRGVSLFIKAWRQDEAQNRNMKPTNKHNMAPLRISVKGIRGISQNTL